MVGTVGRRWVRAPKDLVQVPIKVGIDYEITSLYSVPPRSFTSSAELS
jgi:hypothetical protein